MKTARGAATTTVRNHLVRSTKAYKGERGETIYDRYHGLVVGGRFYDEDFAGGRIDELRVLNAEAGDLVARYPLRKTARRVPDGRRPRRTGRVLRPAPGR